MWVLLVNCNSKQPSVITRENGSIMQLQNQPCNELQNQPMYGAILIQQCRLISVNLYCHFDQQCKSGRPNERKQLTDHIKACLCFFDHQWYTFLRDHTNWKWPILNGFWIKCSHKCCLFRTPVSVILIFCFYQLIVDASKPVYAQSRVCKQFRCFQNGVNCMAWSFSPVFPVWHWHLECRLTKHV